MSQAAIFANGKMNQSPNIASQIQNSDLIIAADGGIQNCKSIGIKPDVIIGDLDSIATDEVAIYRNAGVELIQYPTHKDETDLELALRFARQREISEVIIYGALGSRWDMTLANILLLANPMFDGLKIRLLDGNQELVLLKADTRADFYRRSGDTLSLVPLAGDVHEITTYGLEYPLENETLVFGSTRGISNVFIDDHAQIIFKEGLLLCIINGGVA